MFKHFETLPSTNDYCLSYAKSNPGERLVCTASTQTHGRGRGAKAWVSSGQNLYLSYLRPIHCSLEDLSAITLMTGWVVCRYIASLGINAVAIKWPNDVLINGAKVCGILTEVAHASEQPTVVIGLGLNIEPVDAVLDQPAAALSQFCDTLPDRQAMAAAIIDHLDTAIIRFEQDGFGAFVDDWAQFDALKNNPITWMDGQRSGSAHAVGVDAKGRLMLDCEPYVLSSGSVQRVK